VNGVRGDYTNLYADVDLNLSDLLSNLLTKPPTGADLTPGTKSQSHVSIPGMGG